MLQHQNSETLAPINTGNGMVDVIKQRIKAADDLFSTALSRVSQPVEAIFNWLIENMTFKSLARLDSLGG